MSTKSLLSLLVIFGLSSAVFGQAHLHHGHCGCLHGLPGNNVNPNANNYGSELEPFYFFNTPRWTTTATNGATGPRGNPVTLTWGIVADGTPVTGGFGEPAAPSNLINMLDTQFGLGPGGALAPITDRPWFTLFEQSYNRWGQVSGLDFLHQPNDDGVTVPNFSGNANRADMRVSGHFIDGAVGSNTLAYNYSPNSGDMVIDTSNTFNNPTNGSRFFRNMLMHEIGHGLGIRHIESNNAGFLMEPFISTAFDGPQLDDILSAHRQYGDVNEKGFGNDTSFNATSLGALTSGVTVSIGTDAATTVVGANDIDFVSIDGSTLDSSNDIDFYEISISTLSDLEIVLTPLGPIYNTAPQTNPSTTQVAFDTSMLNDLQLALYDGVGLIQTVNLTGLGGIETILANGLVAGNYFIEVFGTQDMVQFYQLDITATEVPEPSTYALLLTAGIFGFFIYRRREQAPLATAA